MMKDRPQWLHDCLVRYKNAHMGLDLTEVKDEKPMGDILAEAAVPPPLIIAGIEDADE